MTELQKLIDIASCAHIKVMIWSILS